MYITRSIPRGQYHVVNIMLLSQVSDVMREKPGSVTKLMYQLFIALNRKEQQNLTSHAMEAMKSSQKMTLETANAEFYQNVSYVV